ncbi:sarcoglycan beta [Haematobia irritans]|uniref:sarcoglycan beta n=1 Tax=Haematobia irritans TaxID=7368 RepID=UPI003F50B953
MKSFENTFIRGPSPSYSEEVNSDHVTLPIGHFLVDKGHLQKEKLTPTKSEGRRHDCNSKPMTRGRNTFAFWSIVTILLVLTLGNLLLTLSIIGVLHLGKGIYGMELIPEDIVKFYGETDLDKIFSKNVGQLEGFLDEPVVIEGESAPVYVRLHHRNSHGSNRLIVDNGGVQLRGVNNFELKDPKTSETIFTTHRPHYTIPNGASVLISKVNSASRIVSPADKSFVLSSVDNRIAVRGSEGIVIDSAVVSMKTELNVSINSTQGATHLDGGSSGIFLDMNKIPIVNTDMGLRTGNLQYKLCVCMPQGKLFRIEIPQEHNGSKVSCGHFSSKYDPCGIN